MNSGIPHPGNRCKSPLIEEFTEGKVLLFNKPFCWTSYDLVHKVKNILKTQLGIKKIKIGHAGTLDPLASGLMIICTGKETRHIDMYQSEPKEYLAKIRLGATTPSFDLETDTDHVYPISHITRQKVKDVLKNLTGRQMQNPPQYSAKSVKGVRAYRYARKGETIELKAKEIVIQLLKLVAFNLPIIEVKILCSTGTYIRALTRDIGLHLASGAHLAGLIRTRIGKFEIIDALSINEFERNLVFL